MSRSSSGRAVAPCRRRQAGCAPTACDGRSIGWARAWRRRGERTGVRAPFAARRECGAAWGARRRRSGRWLWPRSARQRRVPHDVARRGAPARAGDGHRIVRGDQPRAASDPGGALAGPGRNARGARDRAGACGSSRRSTERTAARPSSARCRWRAARSSRRRSFVSLAPGRSMASQSSTDLREHA